MARRETLDEIRFLLNGRPVSLSGFRCDRTLLDWLRNDNSLTGTKEGCAEGDCGACTVLVGRLSGKGVVYEPVNACIRFLASLNACHIVTVEGLAGSEGLHAVQQALVEHHGSQCGFCTPGFVMSLYALWMNDPKADDRAIEKALQGNLCRCTGYEPIIKAARAAIAAGGQAHDALVRERRTVLAALKSMQPQARIVVEGEGTSSIIPHNVDDLADALSRHPEARIVAGSTDVGLWVTKHFRAISPAIFIGHLDGLRDVKDSRDGLSILGGTSYREAQGALAKLHPSLGLLVDRIGGEQVRAMGTIGGNIANGSPIGDMPPPLIALGATVTLRKGAKRRTVPLEKFFIAYGKQDRKPGEFVERVDIPKPGKRDLFAVYKVSKRRDEDITAVLGAFRVTLSNGKVAEVRLAFGGMAGTPMRAARAERALSGTAWSEAAVRSAMAALAEDFKPLSDWRASADYRLLVAQNLLLRFWLENGGSPQPVVIDRYRELA